MTPMDLLLYTLALLPLLIVLAALVNLVVNNTATHRETVNQYRAALPRPSWVKR